MGGGGASASARVMSSSNYERATTGVKKMNIATVIPCPRKSVKRMIFEGALHFIARFVSFRTRKSSGPPPRSTAS